MKKYDRYKKTNIDWIGDIPEHWEVKKLRYVSSHIFAGGTPSTNIEEYWNRNDYIWLPSGRIQNKEIQKTEDEKYVSQFGLDNSSTKLIEANTTLIALTGATCGNVGYLTFDACANQSVVSIKSDKSFNSKFLFYYLLSQKEPIVLKKSGGAQGGINTEDVKSLDFVTPSIDEQTQISTYLDKKTSLIDKLINNNKRLIKLLEEKRIALINKVITKGLDPNVKMKDSGIEWIGDIPEHWEILRLKYAAQLVTEKATEEPALRKVALENIQSKKSKYIETSNDFQGNGVAFKEGDVLYGKLRPYLVKVWVAEFEGLAVGDFFVLRNNKNIISQDYLRYLLMSDLYTQLINSSTFGAKMPRVSWEFMTNIRLVLPTLSEQVELVSYLDALTEKIDRRIQLFNDQNVLLKEYRQSLISNVVTGKIKVTNL